MLGSGGDTGAARSLRAWHAEVVGRGTPIAHHSTTHEWGGTDFHVHVRDPDGNVMSFVQYG